MWRTVEPSFVCVGERWDDKKYCRLCCIKGLILFFTNIVVISNIYNFTGFRKFNKLLKKNKYLDWIGGKNNRMSGKTLC
jgi:hypothetical protein